MKKLFRNAGLLLASVMALASAAAAPVVQHVKQRAAHHMFMLKEVTLYNMVERATRFARLYAFQSTIAANLGFGVIGEIIFDGPTRAQPGVVKGPVGTPTVATNIVVGRAFTIDPLDGQFSPGGDGLVFGGILANPKGLASYGTAAGGPLAPTLNIPVGTVGEFLTMGLICVRLENAAVVGAGVFYDDLTGALSGGVAGAGQTQIADAQIVRYANAAAGLAVISLTGA